MTEIARAIARRGAYYLPRINWGPDRFRTDIDWALEAPLELLGELPPIERYAVEHEDARLTIRAPEDVHAGAELDPERRRLMQQSMAPASKRARSLDVRWAVVEYPTAAAAEQAGMTLDEYADFVYDACLLDWDAEEERMRGDQGSGSTGSARSTSRAKAPTSRSGSRDARASSRRASATCRTERSSTARWRTAPRA